MSKTSKVKATVLLPLRDNDGVCLDRENVAVLGEVMDVFGGYTEDSGYTQGTYKMDDGSIARDDCIRFHVVVDSLRIPELLAMTAGWCKQLRQESLYVELTNPDVRFVTPT